MSAGRMGLNTLRLLPRPIDTDEGTTTDGTTMVQGGYFGKVASFCNVYRGELFMCGGRSTSADMTRATTGCGYEVIGLPYFLKRGKHFSITGYNWVSCGNATGRLYAHFRIHSRCSVVRRRLFLYEEVDEG